MGFGRHFHRGSAAGFRSRPCGRESMWKCKAGGYGVLSKHSRTRTRELWWSTNGCRQWDHYPWLSDSQVRRNRSCCVSHHFPRRLLHPAGGFHQQTTGSDHRVSLLACWGFFFPLIIFSCSHFTHEQNLRPLILHYFRLPLLVFSAQLIHVSACYFCLICSSWSACCSYAEQNIIPDIGAKVMGWFPKQQQWCRAQVMKICGVSEGGSRFVNEYFWV